jgi:hypothetical protein
LRLVPVFPFFFVNLVMGLTALPLRTFVWVSDQPAGIWLRERRCNWLASSPDDILSGSLLASFVPSRHSAAGEGWLTGRSARGFVEVPAMPGKDPIPGVTIDPERARCPR